VVNCEWATSKRKKQFLSLSRRGIVTATILLWRIIEYAKRRLRRAVSALRSLSLSLVHFASDGVWWWQLLRLLSERTRARRKSRMCTIRLACMYMCIRDAPAKGPNSSTSESFSAEITQRYCARAWARKRWCVIFSTLGPFIAPTRRHSTNCVSLQCELPKQRFLTTRGSWQQRELVFQSSYHS
jgi:hypothetical protein